MSAHTNPYSAARGGSHTVESREWVVLLTPDTRRMMSTLEVQAEVSAGVLARETLVWRAGMSEWVAIGNIGELGLPIAQAHREPPTSGWEASPVAGHRSASHAQARHAPRRASNSELMQELVTTGAVAGIVVAMTLYMLSLGGAFAPGSAPHHSGHAPQAKHASPAPKSH